MPIADLIPYQFTKESASLGGKRSGEVRRAKALWKQTFDKPPGQDTVRAFLNAQLNLVNEQITLTREVLNNKDIEPHHRAQLLKALDSLLDRIPTPRKAPPHPGNRSGLEEKSMLNRFLTRSSENQLSTDNGTYP